MKNLFYCIISTVLLVSCSRGNNVPAEVSQLRDSANIVWVLPPDARVASSTIDYGQLRAGVDTVLYFSIRNLDSVGVKIDTVKFSHQDRKPVFTRDTIGPQTIIGAGIRFVTPDTPGEFSCEMSIHSKNVSKPAIFVIKGEIK